MTDETCPEGLTEEEEEAWHMMRAAGLYWGPDGDVRPVWLTREQRDFLVRVGTLLHPQLDVTLSDDIVAAWHAAPADAVEAVFKGLTNKAVATGWVLYADAARALVPGVLNTLNYPKGETHE